MNMNRYYPLELLIKDNLKNVVECMKELKAKRDEYTRNPGIITQREARYVKDKLLLLIEEASNRIQKEWEYNYANCVSYEEVWNLTNSIMNNLVKEIDLE